MVVLLSVLLLAACGGRASEKRATPTTKQGTQAQAKVTPGAKAAPAGTAKADQVAASIPVAADLSKGDAKKGQELFQGKGACVACHKVGGTGGEVGPPLDGIAARPQIVSAQGTANVAAHCTNCILTNTPENLWRWIKDPQKIKPGTAMAPGPLSNEEIADVVAYLQTLK